MRIIRKFLRKYSKILALVSVGFAVLALALSAAGARPVYAQGLADGVVPPPPAPGVGLLGPGVARYLAILAIASIPESAQCDTGGGSGTFGYLGDQYNLGNDVSGHYNPYDTWDGTPGANGRKTGDNNSAVCGDGH